MMSGFFHCVHVEFTAPQTGMVIVVMGLKAGA